MDAQGSGRRAQGKGLPHPEWVERSEAYIEGRGREGDKAIKR